MPELYGATVAGVVNLLPELHLDAADPAVIARTGPLIEFAANYVTDHAGATLRALAAVEGPEADAVYADLFASAGRVVEVGAASMLQDSSYPELAATDETAQAWGAVLWQRFVDALAGLVLGVETEMERLGVEALTGEAALPAVAAPPPFFTSRMRF